MISRDESDRALLLPLALRLVMSNQERDDIKPMLRTIGAATTNGM